MKKLILLAGLLAGASGLVAQTLLTNGEQYVIGGWDFNGFSTGTSSVASQNARYNQQFAPYFVAGAGANTGSAAFDTIATFSGSNGATFASARSVASSNAPVYDLLADAFPSPTLNALTASNNSLGDQTATSVRSILLSTNTALDNARATFKINTLNAFNQFENINVAYSARNQGTANATIGWSYSLDGVNFTSIAGQSSVVAPSGTAYSVFTADFSAITALEGLVDVWLGLDYVEDALAASVFLDNVAIYGTAAELVAIPEPSTYAAILGAMALGVAAIRRRRQAALAA